MGSRRAFICRMKIGNMQIPMNSSAHASRMRHRNTLGPSRDGQQFAVVHCTGYVKNWPPSGLHVEVLDREGGEGSGGGHCCLVAIGRLQVTSSPSCGDLSGPNPPIEFISRHSTDGKFTFIDLRVTGVLGYEPVELLGKTCYDFYHMDDQAHMKQNFEQVVKLKGQVVSVMYRFRAKTGEFVTMRTSSFAFLNPYTEELEYIVATNTLAKAIQQQIDQQMPEQQTPISTAAARPLNYTAPNVPNPPYSDIMYMNRNMQASQQPPRPADLYSEGYPSSRHAGAIAYAGSSAGEQQQGESSISYSSVPYSSSSAAGSPYPPIPQRVGSSHEDQQLWSQQWTQNSGSQSSTDQPSSQATLQARQSTSQPSTVQPGEQFPDMFRMLDQPGLVEDMFNTFTDH